ncbi:hypothetical protein ACFU96_02965 [Streptomyces sp. NPDC057620]|uniref:hypothetical protein n=1 Tax=Streptomyces sp. NPDC057620 TaxID=3346185 RepID=UPI0036A8EAD2
MDAGVAAILGAAIGAVGGVGGGLLTLSTQLRSLDAQHRAEEKRWLADVRRETYTSFIACAKQLSNAVWKASDLLHAEAGVEDWERARSNVHDAWTQLSAASAAVTMAGPHTVAAAAEDLREALRQWELLTGTWIRAAIQQGTGQLAEHDQRFMAGFEAKKPLEVAFQVAARRALGTDT